MASSNVLTSEPWRDADLIERVAIRMHSVEIFKGRAHPWIDTHEKAKAIWRDRASMAIFEIFSTGSSTGSERGTSNSEDAGSSPAPCTTVRAPSSAGSEHPVPNREVEGSSPSERANELFAALKLIAMAEEDGAIARRIARAALAKTEA